jgi:hypothetical protein
MLTIVMPELRHSSRQKKSINGEKNVKGTEITIGKEVINAVTIIRPLEDAEDFRKGRIKAQLLPDRSGIMFSLPSVLAYLLDPTDIKPLYALDGNGVCAATRRTHEIVTTDLQVDDEHRLRRIIARFPTGITCSNRHFNNGEDGNHNLKTHFHMYKNDQVLKGGKKVAYPKAHIRWKLVVETGRTRRTAPATSGENYDADIEKAFQDLGL